MGNKKLLMIGIIIFAVLATFPFWYNRGKAAPAPDPVLTEQAKAAKECVLATEYMRKDHMKVLDLWRHTVVRNGERIFVNPSGKEFTMSLTNTCLNCHSNKAEFCDRCHNYASVSPYCWDCHNDNPKEIK